MLLLLGRTQKTLKLILAEPGLKTSTIFGWLERAISWYGAFRDRRCDTRRYERSLYFHFAVFLMRLLRKASFIVHQKCQYLRCIRVKHLRLQHFAAAHTVTAHYWHINLTSAVGCQAFQPKEGDNPITRIQEDRIN
jgi:hypothetical protein